MSVDKQKRISVIIPCYNVEAFVDRCLTSVVKQTIGLKALEIILVNDASTDQTLAHLMAWEQQYPDDIMVISLDQNMKLGYVRNLAMQYATCEYLCFVDSDDWLSINALEHLYEVQGKSGADIVWGAYQNVTAFEGYVAFQKGEVSSYDLTRDQIRKQFLIDPTQKLIACGNLYKKEAIGDVRFLEQVRYEDISFSLLLHCQVRSIAILNEPVYFYYKNEKSITNLGNESQRLEKLIAVRMFYREIKNRGYLELYYPEMELIFIYKYYLEIMEMMFRHFKTLDYSVMCGIRSWLKEHFPKYGENPYLSAYFPEAKQQLELFEQIHGQEKLEAVRSWFQQKQLRSNEPCGYCEQDKSRGLFWRRDELQHCIKTLLPDRQEELLEVFCQLPVWEEAALPVYSREHGISLVETYRFFIDREMMIYHLKNGIEGVPDSALQSFLKQYKERSFQQNGSDFL